MKWRTEELPIPVLFLITGLSVLALVFAERSVSNVQQPYYQEKLHASKVMLLAMNAVKAQEAAMGFTIDLVNDPSATGMIGTEFTFITTDRGDLPAKLLTTNPNFAAVVVDMLGDAKLKKDDVVAVGVTGSFPALNIAVLSALETMELKPLVITSLGSSSWGANDPRMTWLDMERLLNEKRILRARSIASSIGGGKDLGRGLSPEGRDLILQAIQRNQVTPMNDELLEDNIRHRLQIYNAAAGSKNIKAYINVGGGVASLGSSINGDLFPSGLSLSAGFHNFPTKGVLMLMAERGIPVIHLLNISEIAKRYGLSEEEAPGSLGQGPVYYKARYDRIRLLVIIIVLVAITIVLARLNLSHYLSFLRQIHTREINAGTAILPPMESGDPSQSDQP